MIAEIYTGLYDSKKRSFLKAIGATQQDKAKRIISIICNNLNVDYEVLKKKWRKREIVLARQVCMYFLKNKTILSLSDIGDLFGGKDHATVIYAIKTVNDIYDTDKKFKKLINQLEAELDIPNVVIAD